MWSKKKCCAIISPCCLVTSLVCTAIAVVLFLEFPHLMVSVAEKLLTIQPGHSAYEQLQDPTLPLYKDIYFFNLTNPEEFSQGARPRVQEVGPYSYREYRMKYFNESSLIDNQTILQYTQLKTFHFSPNTSHKEVKEDDIICTLNIPLVGAVQQVLAFNNTAMREMAIILMKGIFLWKKAKLYVCQPATNLTFHYTDPLVKELHSNPVLRKLHKNLPTDYVSIQHNASINDSFPSQIYTGVDDINKVGQFIQWDGLTDLGVWPGHTANMINGTEGLVFRPNLKEGDDLVAFVDDTLRSFPLVYTEKVKIKGLDAFRYKLAPTVFQSAYTNPDNARWGSWCPDGLIYLGVVQQPNVPIYGSKARFMDCAPEKTRNQVDGILQPNGDQHETIINVHPMIGVNLQFQKVLQINVQVTKTDHFSQLKRINGTIYYPVLYVNEHTVLTDDFKSYLMKSGLRELQVATDIQYALFALLLFVACIAVLVSIASFGKVVFPSRRAGYTQIRADTEPVNS